MNDLAYVMVYAHGKFVVGETARGRSAGRDYIVTWSDPQTLTLQRATEGPPGPKHHARIHWTDFGPGGCGTYAVFELKRSSRTPREHDGPQPPAADATGTFLAPR